jgi:hypothetical protein
VQRFRLVILLLQKPQISNLAAGQQVGLSEWQSRRDEPPVLSNRFAVKKLRQQPYTQGARNATLGFVV